MSLARIVQFPATRTFRPEPSRRAKLFAITSQLTPTEIDLMVGIAERLLAASVRGGALR